MAWQKGESGNPGGRPREEAEVKALAREHTRAAVDRLAHWLQSENAKASVAAAIALLDRAYGKPAQAVTGGDGEGPVKLIVEWANEGSDGT